MKIVKKERDLPPELRTKAARAAFNYAGEDLDVEHVRWLGTDEERAPGFTRHDFEDLFGVIECTAYEGTPGEVSFFQALGQLKDGRIALVEAVTRGEWVSSSGVAKVTPLIVQMGDYLSRSERNKGDPMHDGRLQLLASLRLRLETDSIRAATAAADDAFAEVESTLGGR